MELNKLYLGDCLEVMPREIPDKSVDCIICDLPYGTTACKWDVVIDFNKLWTEYKRILKDNCAIVLFGSEPFSSLMRMSNFNEFKYDWIWDKQQGTGFTTSKILPLKQHEIISVFGKDKIKYFPQMVKREKPIDTRGWKQNKLASENGNYGSKDNSVVQKVYDEKFPTSLISINRSAKECNNTKRVHPTQKPLELLEYLIKTYTNENDLVLDNCAGSGSTLIAARRTNRNWIGIEKDENYFNIANQRLQQELI